MEIRETIIHRIREAYSGVDREDGTSVEEAWVLDGHGPENELKVARTSAVDEPWEKTDTRSFTHFSSLFCFLDPKGFRFYLPSCMVWILQNFDSTVVKIMLQGLVSHLSLKSCIQSNSELQSVDERIRNEKLANYSILTLPQKQAVAEFLEFATTSADCDIVNDAQIALEFYWIEYLVGV